MNNEQCYNEALQRDFGINFDEMRTKNGGWSGIYYEVGYLMSKLISHPHVSRVLESGAGFSSMLYATIAKRYDKFFVSLEDKEEWADLFNTNLRAVPELVGDFQVVRTESDPAKCPVFTEPFQLAWIDGNLAWFPDKGIPHDCCHRPGAVRYYKDVLMDALIIFDDGEDTHCRVEIDKVMREMGRDPSKCFIWNPVGRQDRNQWVCPPPNETPLLDVLDEVASLVV